MNPSEKIVKTYYEHIENLFTRANIKVVGNCELDLVGVRIDKDIEYYHIETTISIADGFSKISNTIYSPEAEKLRNESAKQKKTAGYFISKKFNTDEVNESYRKIGIDTKKLKKIVVAWDFEEEAREELSKNGIQCKSIKSILQELSEHMQFETSNIDDDILKTIQLMVKSSVELPKPVSNATARKKKKEKETANI